MADDNKPAPDIDDWDSLPLVPGDDDWDDIPPAVIPPADPDSSGSPSTEPAGPTGDQTADTADGEPAGSLLTPRPGRAADLDPSPEEEAEGASADSFSQGAESPPADQPSPLEIPLDSELASLADSPDLAGDPAPVTPVEPESMGADSIELADDFAALELDEEGEEPEDSEDAAPADDFDSLPDIPLEAFSRPQPPEPRKKPPAADGEADDQTSDEAEDFNAHLGALALDEAFAKLESPEVPAQASDPEPEPDPDPPLTPTKVELDLEGIFLDDLPGGEPLEAQPEEPPPAAPAPAELPPAEVLTLSEEETGRALRRSRTKLLLIVVPAVLLLLGLGFGIYKLFFASGPAGEAEQPLVIDPRVPFREPEPGTMDLRPFFINFRAVPSEIIVEMRVTLHYNDQPDKETVEARLPVVRDIVMRITQGKGRQVVTDGDLQRELRQELAEAINTALEGEKISYVQINQIRLLQ